MDDSSRDVPVTRERKGSRLHVKQNNWDDDDDDDDDDDNNNEAVIVRRRRALIALPNALYALILFLVCGENNNENIYPFQWCVEK